MNHPRLGEIDELEGGGWGVTLSLPAFQPFYERWTEDGDERRDTRGEDERAGRFWVIMPRVFADGPGRHGVQPPSDCQVAAVEYLRDNQERVAKVVKQALVEEAPRVFDWDYLGKMLSDSMKEKLATPDGMMQVVELQTVVIGVQDEDGQAKIGFALHSQMLEGEHGVSVVVHRERPVFVSTCDDLMDMDRPDEGAYGLAPADEEDEAD